MTTQQQIDAHNTARIQRMVEAQNSTTWQPEFSRWRHGGWYVDNLCYPSGAIGCVSNNYDDKKWRIACDPRPFNEQPTFKNRTDAAFAERELVCAKFQTHAAPVPSEQEVTPEPPDSVTCPNCCGSGGLEELPCSKCKGSGVLAASYVAGPNTLPWVVQVYNSRTFVMEGCGKSFPARIAEVGTPNHEANAKLIVEAVNSYAELKGRVRELEAALQATIKWLDFAAAKLGDVDDLDRNIRKYGARKWIKQFGEGAGHRAVEARAALSKEKQ